MFTRTRELVDALLPKDKEEFCKFALTYMRLMLIGDKTPEAIELVKNLFSIGASAVEERMKEVISDSNFTYDNGNSASRDQDSIVANKAELN